jgi:vitamin B12 transporter
MTVSGQQRVGDVGLRASFDLQDPHDRETGNRLARRAQRYVNLGADTNVWRWGVGGDLRWTDERYNDDANTIVLPAYTLLSLYAQTRLSPDWSLSVTVDNATDTEYQLADGYATAGRTFFVTLKWEPSARSTP